MNNYLILASFNFTPTATVCLWFGLVEADNGGIKSLDRFVVLLHSHAGTTIDLLLDHGEFASDVAIQRWGAASRGFTRVIEHDGLGTTGCDVTRDGHCCELVTLLWLGLIGSPYLDLSTYFQPNCRDIRSNFLT